MDNTKILKFFWGYWMRQPWRFGLGLLYGPVSAVQNVLVPLFVTLSLTQLIKTGHAHVSTMVLAVLSLAIAVLLDYIVDVYADARIEKGVELAMYHDLFKLLTNQDYDFYANNFGGSLVTKNNQLVKAYSIFHITFFLDILPQFFVVLFAFGIMLHLNIALGGVILLVWGLSMAAIIYLAVERIPLRREAVAFGSKQTGELADAVTNAMAVKTFAAEPYELARYDATNKFRSDLFYSSWQKAIRNGGVVNALCAVIQVFVFVGGIYAIEHHAINLPVFLLFQVYALRIVDSLRHTNQIVRQLEGVFGDAADSLELLDVRPSIVDMQNAPMLDAPKGSLNFHAVSFRYEDAKTSKLFDNLNLQIPGSQKIGLVGPSGGGKSTITKLILRFMDVQAGKIAIDGQAIQAVTQQSLRQAISYVPQEPLLFHRSIRENIAYGKPAADEAEIIAVAQKAFAHGFIMQLPNGYDTLVGERGVKLSGGQRQRVAIARAMLKDAPILILDEATSALDSESEKVIQQALWELMESKTAIVIAHRLSTIQKLDRIIVLNEGVIQEDGTHADLLTHKGLYAKLWSHQSGGFIDE